METNGQGESRLDQLERLMAQHVIKNHDAHAEFRSEHHVLLVAQAALNAQLIKLAESMGRLRR